MKKSKIYAANLIDRLKEAGMSPVRLAMILDVTPHQVIKYTLGLAYPDQGTRLKIADALQVSQAELEGKGPAAEKFELFRKGVVYLPNKGRLLELIQGHALSNREVALRVGINPSTMCNIMRMSEEDQYYAPETINKLAVFFGVDPLELIDGEVTQKRPGSGRKKKEEE